MFIRIWNFIFQVEMWNAEQVCYMPNYIDGAFFQFYRFPKAFSQLSHQFKSYIEDNKV